MRRVANYSILFILVFLPNLYLRAQWQFEYKDRLKAYSQSYDIRQQYEDDRYNGYKVILGARSGRNNKNISNLGQTFIYLKKGNENNPPLIIGMYKDSETYKVLREAGNGPLTASVINNSYIMTEKMEFSIDKLQHEKIEKLLNDFNIQGDISNKDCLELIRSVGESLEIIMPPIKKISPNDYITNLFFDSHGLCGKPSDNNKKINFKLKEGRVLKSFVEFDYTGKIDSQGRPNGTGIYHSNSYYQKHALGYFNYEKGIQIGTGILVTKTSPIINLLCTKEMEKGAIFKTEGTFLNNKPDGFCITNTNTNFSINAGYTDGKPIGECTFQKENQPKISEHYKGDGKIPPKIYFQSDLYIEADWIEGDYLTGPGKLVTKDYTVSGQFKRGMIEGKADVDFKGGDKFSGLYSQGNANGLGVYAYKNGDKITGVFTSNESGELSGNLKFIWINGDYQNCLLRNGKITYKGDKFNKDGVSYKDIAKQKEKEKQATQSAAGKTGWVYRVDKSGADWVITLEKYSLVRVYNKSGTYMDFDINMFNWGTITIHQGQYCYLWDYSHQMWAYMKDADHRNY
ncbi:hypothetical protein [Flavobacterium anhuiense]|uniref:hypothetical protein n=1 Tax=Flavobacterium anhuiense TaxID=459526 RepID=UPI0034D95A4C